MEAWHQDSRTYFHGTGLVMPEYHRVPSPHMAMCRCWSQTHCWRRSAMPRRSAMTTPPGSASSQTSASMEQAACPAHPSPRTSWNARAWSPSHHPSAPTTSSTSSLLEPQSTIDACSGESDSEWNGAVSDCLTMPHSTMSFEGPVRAR